MSVQSVYVGDNMADWGFDPYIQQIGRVWTGTGTQTFWNGPICHVCRKPYSGICAEDHRPYLAVAYIGRHRA